MRTMFDPTLLSGLPLANRFVRSATQEFLADPNGNPTDNLIDVYTRLAAERVGLIITGWAYVLPDGRSFPTMLGISDDFSFDAFRRLTSEVHDKGGKIVLQIGYGGPLSFVDTSDVFSPSGIADKTTGKTGKAMTVNDIRRLTQAFGDAAVRARAAGFDGVQIHAGHGFLLSQFLSPYYNHRDDEYGGSVENRTRLLLDVYAAVRQSSGADFPILAKINCADFIDDGLTSEESLYICEQLASQGLDAVEVSGGMAARPNILEPDQEAYFAAYAAKIAAKVSIPVILVGGLRSLPVMERLLIETEIAYFSLCRPLLADPMLIRRWQEGAREKARCVACNKCMNPPSPGCCTVFGGQSSN